MSKWRRVQIAERLVNIKANVRLPQPTPNSSSTLVSITGCLPQRDEFEREPSRGPRWTIAHNARVLPAHVPQHMRRVSHSFESNHKAYSNIAVADTSAAVNTSLETIFSCEERELFIKKTSKYYLSRSTSCSRSTLKWLCLLFSVSLSPISIVILHG